MNPEEEIYREAETIMRSSCHSWDEALRRAKETYRPAHKPPEFVTVPSESLAAVIQLALASPAARSMEESGEKASEMVRALARCAEIIKPADRWEYKLVDLPAMVGRFATSEGIEEILRPYGLEGWELVHVGGAAWMKRRLGS